MDQGANISRVADQIVRQLGERAFEYRSGRAEFAKLGGDIESAITRWDIALAVVEVQNERTLPQLQP